MRRSAATYATTLLCGALLATGCGSSENEESGAAEPQASARPADFPAARGRTIADLQTEAKKTLVLAPSVQDLSKGRNRFGFAVFDTARKQVSGTPVALYVAREDGSGLRGPYVARSESLAVKGPFQSTTTNSDPDAARSVYVADVPFRRNGRHVVTALVRLDGRMVATNAFGMTVGARGPRPPAVGQKAVRVHTDTPADVGGDYSQISTRSPPAEDLHEVDFADVLGKRPIVITFATPLLCASRVCGPVVDIVEQVKSRAPEEVAFVHQEIFADNQVDKGVRPQVVAWRLQSEPWTFVIDRAGRVAVRFEGAFSAGELTRAVAKVR